MEQKEKIDPNKEKEIKEILEAKKLKISELELPDIKKKILAYVFTARTASQICAKFDCSYSYAMQLMGIFEAKGWVKRSSFRGRKTLFKVDISVLEP